MEFQRSFLEKLDKRFEDELFLTELFLDFYRKLETFDNELEKYMPVGLDVLFEAAENAAALKIENYFIRLDLIFQDPLPFIQVSCGKANEEDNPVFLDHIYADKLEYPESLYWKTGAVAAFDTYLQSAFEPVLRP